MAVVTDGDRVKDSTTTTGTGSVTLSGTAPTGFRTFASVAAVGDNLYYCIVDDTAGDWEVGYGTLTASTTLARSRVITSSNSGALVTFAAGTKTVFITAPARLIKPTGLGWAIANAYTIN
jgi:hypothetical protein